MHVIYYICMWFIMHVILKQWFWIYVFVEIWWLLSYRCSRCSIPPIVLLLTKPDWSHVSHPSFYVCKCYIFKSGGFPIITFVFVFLMPGKLAYENTYQNETKKMWPVYPSFAKIKTDTTLAQLHPVACNGLTNWAWTVFLNRGFHFLLNFVTVLFSWVTGRL